MSPRRQIQPHRPVSILTTSIADVEPMDPVRFIRLFVRRMGKRILGKLTDGFVAGDTVSWYRLTGYKSMPNSLRLISALYSDDARFGCFIVRLKRKGN